MKAVFLDFDTMGPADIDISALERLLPGIELYSTTSQEQLNPRVRDAEIIIVNKIRLDDDAFDAAPGLKLVCLAATGTDNVALEAARNRGIAVCNIRDYCTPSVVQHVFALILSLTHHIDEYRELLLKGAWADSPQFCLLDYPIRELDGKSIGIVGLGNLGRGVAAVASAFGMQVLAAQPPDRPPANGAGDGPRRLPLQQLLELADVVSLHCPLNPQTERLIDAQALTTMRRDALLINTARGGLVDSRALVDALRNGEIAGAGIDVLAQEPPMNGDPLLEVKLPNLIVTPHIAWAGIESRQRALDQIIANIGAFINGEERNRV